MAQVDVTWTASAAAIVERAKSAKSVTSMDALAKALGRTDKDPILRFKRGELHQVGLGLLADLFEAASSPKSLRRDITQAWVAVRMDKARRTAVHLEAIQRVEARHGAEEAAPLWDAAIRLACETSRPPVDPTRLGLPKNPPRD